MIEQTGPGILYIGSFLKWTVEPVKFYSIDCINLKIAFNDHVFTWLNFIDGIVVCLLQEFISSVKLALCGRAFCLQMNDE